MYDLEKHTIKSLDSLNSTAKHVRGPRLLQGGESGQLPMHIRLVPTPTLTGVGYKCLCGDKLAAHHRIYVNQYSVSSVSEASFTPWFT